MNLVCLITESTHTPTLRIDGRIKTHKRSEDKLVIARKSAEIPKSYFLRWDISTFSKPQYDIESAKSRNDKSAKINTFYKKTYVIQNTLKKIKRWQI